MRTISQVGIIINPGLPEAAETAHEAKAWLDSRGVASRIGAIKVSADVGSAMGLRYPDPSDVIGGCDLIVVIGGDGTLLTIARTRGSESVPILAVNLGNVGFLTEVTRKELDAALARLLSGDYETEERMMLEYEATLDGKPMAGGYALNDLVIREDEHLVELDVYMDEEYVVRLRGDGLIVSTPTGSTAYSCSAGGPIVHPSCGGILLTPICSFALAMRPILVPPSAEIRIIVQSKTPTGVLRADGQEQYRLRQGCHIAARRADRTITLVRSSERDFFGVLRTKLHLGNLPGQ